jgi:Chemoreceptor zinc-binding domain
MRPSSSLIEAINAGLAAHTEWKQWFYQHMAGIIHLQEIEQTSLCPCGRWLEGEGKTRLVLADYAVLYQLHAEFHRVAALLVWQRRRGFQEKDLETMEHGREFCQVSDQIMNTLQAIQEKQSTLLNPPRPVFNKPG